MKRKRATIGTEKKGPNMTTEKRYDWQVTWAEMQDRKDVIGGHLEVFEGGDPNGGRNFRGEISVVDWDALMPVFHLVSVREFDFTSNTWSPADPEKVEVCYGITGREQSLVQNGEGVFFCGWSTRYYFLPKDKTLDDKPFLPPPVSYEEWERRYVMLFSKRGILGFK